MEVKISNEITIIQPTPQVIDWVYDNLILDNPEYKTMKFMGKEDLIKWKRIPEKINLFYEKFASLILPFGCLYSIWPMIKNCNIGLDFNNAGDISVKNDKPTYDLYDYQEEAVDTMVKAKGGVLVSPAGSGKTTCGIEIIRRIGKKALWLCHTGDLLRQAKDDMLSMYPNMKIGLTTKGKLEIGEDVTISTIQTLEKIDPDLYKDAFDVIICDECFPKGTKISTHKGDKNIEDINIGDEVYSYNENTKKIELKKVLHLFKRVPHSLHVIKLNNKEEILCTENHPIYTKRGYIQAKEVNKNDYVLCLLPKRIRYKNMVQDISEQKQKKRMGLLQQKLFEEIRNRKESDVINYGISKKMERKHEKDKRFSKNDRIKRISKGNAAERGNKKEIERESKAKGYTYSISRWEWKRNSETAKSIIQLSKKRKKYRLLFRVCCKNKNAKKKWISYLLQDRYCDTIETYIDRNRWFKSSTIKNKRKRQKERNFFEWVRVENNSVQKQTSNGTFGGMCSDGYVYNIEVQDNNNYFANNYLVHNCAHVAGSPTKLTMFSKILSKIPARYKYGLTATPKRSDGLINAMYFYLGTNPNGDIKPTFKVEKERVKTIPSLHKRVDIKTSYSEEDLLYYIYDSSGMLVYNNLVSLLSDDDERTDKIIDNVVQCKKEGRKQVVLTLRVEHCQKIVRKLKERGIKTELVVGKVSAKQREKILKQQVEWDVIVATYSLLKEGVSIKELDTLHMATPIKDKAMVVQCAGRIERYLPNKKQPIVYDYVDIDIPYCEKRFVDRRRALKSRF